MPATEQPVPHNNEQLARIFYQMAACYRYLGREERFRANAYENAAKTLSSMREDIAAYATGVTTLDALSGIGESIAEKIMEYLRTGAVQTFEQLKKQVPFALLELMEVTGIGPAAIKWLHEEKHINSPVQLAAAIENCSLKGIKGLGAAAFSNLQRVLKMPANKNRMTLKNAIRAGDVLLKAVQKIPGVLRVELAGSLRRKQATVGDIDMVIAAMPGNRKKIVTCFLQLPIVKQVLAKGLTKISVLLHKPPVQADIRLVQPEEFGAAWLYFTGSREHTIYLRTLAKEKSLKLNEYGLFDVKTGKKLAGETEAGIYEAMGLDYIIPEGRS